MSGSRTGHFGAAVSIPTARFVTLPGPVEVDGVSSNESDQYELARALQLKVRAWAVPNGLHLIQVLRNSGSVADRRVASDALGYAEASKPQILAMTYAASDPDGEVVITRRAHLACWRAGSQQWQRRSSPTNSSVC